MSYVKTNWQTDDIVTAAKLNNIENGIESNYNEIYKYDDVLRVIKITSASTTMGDISVILNNVNTAGDHVVFDVAGLNAGMYLCTIYMGGGYYRIADLVTGFEGTGFYDNDDLLKDIIKSGSQSEGKHYTVQWDQVNAQGTRLNAAASITTTTTNFGHFGSVNDNYSNPFDDIYPWSERKLCNIDIATYRGLSAGASLKDCVVAWEGDVDFDYDHQYGVWVYTPPFFGRSYIMGNYRYFDVTDENLQNNIYYKESLVGRWLGVDVVLTIDGISVHCNLPKTGVPMANIAIGTQHTYAKNYNASLNDIYTLDATSLLYIVEYANINSQNTIGNGVSSLYLQAGIHPAAAVSSSTTLTISGLTDAQKSNFIVGAVVDIGATDGEKTSRTRITNVSHSGSTTTLTLADAVSASTSDFVSIHGLANMADSDIGSASGYIGTNGKSNAYYRGQTFYANKYQYLLGAYRQTGTNKIWIAKEDETDNYDALDTTKHIDTGLVLPSGAEGAAIGDYVKTFGMCEGLSFPPFCTELGGNSTNPIGDYCYVPAKSSGNTVLVFGGSATYSGHCGWYGYWGDSSGNSYWSIGSCPRLKNP